MAASLYTHFAFLPYQNVFFDWLSSDFDREFEFIAVSLRFLPIP